MQYVYNLFRYLYAGIGKSKTFFILSFLIISASSLYAQTDINANTYTFSRSGFAPTALTSPVTLIGPGADDTASPVTDIGFTFWFAGDPYTQFSVSENGLLTLGSTQVSGTDITNDMTSITTNPKIAPYWDDLATGTNGSVVYQVTGTAPTRVLMINWNVTVPKNVGGAANSLIQVQMYESNGNITFTYGNPAVPANANQYTIGIGKTSSDFGSVTPLSATTASINYGISSNTNTISPGVYTRYNFFTDRTAPIISAETIPNTTGTGNRTLTKTITDAKTGVPVSGSFVPRIYFKRNTDVSYVSTAGVLQTGNGNSGTWLFTVDHALLGGVIEGDVIQYFVIAQDQSYTVGAPNISSSPAGVAASDVNTIITPPSPSVYFIAGASLTGTYNVGTGGDYASLTLSGGLFDQLNAGQVTGNITVNLISDLSSETGLIPLNAWTEGAGGPFTLTILPSGGARTITTINTIKINGAKRVLIDGLNDGINSLLITKPAGGSSAALDILNGSSNITITRCSISGYNSLNTGNLIGVNNSSVTPMSNITISYNNITSSNTSLALYQAILLTGTSSICDGLVIDHNTITNIKQYPVQKDYNGRFINLTISNNEIYNTVAVGSGNYFNGIYIQGNSGTTNIFNNKIHDILCSFAGSSVAAIFVTPLAGNTMNIYNNVIYLDAASTSAGQTYYAIRLSNSGTANVDYNSVYIGGTGITAGSSYGINIAGTGSISLLNNAVFNARSNGIGTGKHYGIYSTAAALTSDHNDIFSNGTGGYFGYSGGDRLTIADWRTATGKDINSYSADPGFTSTTDLQPDINNPQANILNNHGLPVSFINSDIFGNPRSTSLPTPTDIGAYEFYMVPATYTISGNAGLAGVTLSWTDGIPQTTTTNGTGDYSITVSYSWSGTVTPSLTGYTFSPADRVYSNVTADQLNQDYTPVPVTFTISGNAGIAAAVLSWNDGGPQTTTANGSGNYTFLVSYNWSGLVTPSLTGYTFTPSGISYTNVLTDQLNQDYSAAPTVFTISGNAGIAGATLSWSDGTPKTTTSAGDGSYSFTVSYNWSGVVTPTLPGYTFIPGNRSYTNVLTDLTGQDYVAAAATFIILGNTGTGGVTLSWFDGISQTKTSSPDGDYNITVSYNWSGTITPSLAGFTFDPVNRTYTNVTSNFINQNYTANPIYYTISGNTGTGGVTLSWDDVPFAPLPGKNNNNTSEGSVKDQDNELVQDVPNENVIAVSNESPIIETKNITLEEGDGKVISPSPSMAPKTLVSNPDGSYSFLVSYNWTGTVTPSLAGFTFTPASISYTNVLTDQPNQNYIADSIKYTISGNTGIAGSVISWFDGTPKSITADGTGAYSFTVSYNWSGNVVPSLTGYSFTPAGRNYANTLADQPNQDYSAIALPAELVGYWMLNEFGSGNYYDATGTNNGTGNLSPLPTAGMVNGAQQFNGTTTKIDVPANPSLDFTAGGDFSVELWFKGATAPTTVKMLISRAMPETSTWWWIAINANTGIVHFHIFGNSSQQKTLTGISVTDGNWHHIAATKNGTTGELKLYVDGVLRASATQVFTVDFSSLVGKLNIGHKNGSYLLSGSLDEIAIHNIELSQATINVHYNNGSLGYFVQAAPSFTTTPITTVITGTLYTYNSNANGYPAPTYSLTTFPVGMTIDPVTGVIQWTPPATGNYNVTVQAANGTLPDATQSFIIKVQDPLILPGSVVAFWRLDETAGNVFSDYTGTNNGTGNLSPLPTAGMVNGAQQFNGTTTKIDVPANPSLDFTAGGDFSVELWFKGATAPTTVKMLISRAMPETSTWWWIAINANTGIVHFHIFGNSSQQKTLSGISVTDGNWHHIAATKNGTTGELKLYVDGVLRASATQVFIVDFSSLVGKLNIGHKNGSYLLSGSLDEIAIHNIELSQATINVHYNNGSLGYFVPAAPLITSNPVITGLTGDVYIYDVNATGYPDPTYSLTLFPLGMSINPSTGVIQWTPSSSGFFDVTVEAANGIAPIFTQSFTIRVANIPIGMAGYWKLDESTSGNYLDLTGVNNGVGTSTPITGLVNGAQLFNGTTDKIDIAANPSLDFTAGGDFSVELWFKGATAPTTVKMLISRAMPETSTWWWIAINANTGIVHFHIFGNSSQQKTLTGISVTDGNWHHIAATKNGTTGELKLYVDGVLRASATQVFTVDFSSLVGKLNIGHKNGSYLLSGSLDEIAIHNIELSSTEITTHYNNGLSGIPLAKRSLVFTDPVFEKVNILLINKKPVLNWKIKSDLNGSFEIQRSGGVESTWTTAGSVSSVNSRSFEYVDNSSLNEGKYSYRIMYLSKDGGYAASESNEVEIIPDEYVLEQNYPNPFNPSTTISYKLPFESKVTILIYNTIGEQVAKLNDEVQQPGAYNQIWNASNLASGVYLLRLDAKGNMEGQKYSKVLKMMLIK